MDATKQVIHYLKGTTGQGIFLEANNNLHLLVL